MSPSVRIVISLLATLLTAAVALPAPAGASGAATCDRFAAPSGDDRASGTAPAPLRTPQRLADALRPGETGCLRGGTYTGTGPVGYVLELDRGGLRGAPVTLRSAPGARATLHGITVLRRGAGHVRLQGLDFDARRPFDPLAGQVGISIFASDVQLAGNRITSSRARSCVLLGSNGSEGGARRTVIRGNRFERCGSPSNGQLDHAIYAAESRRAVIARNVFVDSAGYAVHLYPNAQRTVVRDNVLVGNGGGVIVAGDNRHASSHNLVTGNLIALSRRQPEVVGWFPDKAGRGNVARGNCIAPGQYAYSADNRGLRHDGNRIASASECLDDAPGSTLSGLVDVVRTIEPALADLISARLARR